MNEYLSASLYVNLHIFIVPVFLRNTKSDSSDERVWLSIYYWGARFLCINLRLVEQRTSVCATVHHCQGRLTKTAWLRKSIADNESPAEQEAVPSTSKNRGDRLHYVSNEVLRPSAVRSRSWRTPRKNWRLRPKPDWNRVIENVKTKAFIVYGYSST